MERNANGNTDVWYVAAVSENGIDDLVLFEDQGDAELYAETSDDLETGHAELLSPSVASQLIRDTMGALDRAEARDAEHSERARYVTEQVKLWVANDGDHYETARKLAGHDAAARAATYPLLAEHLYGVLRATSHPRGSAAWQLQQELAPNDYARIHWADVADQLLGE